jgi:membrane protein DedA with SNARE-associated domain
VSTAAIFLLVAVAAAVIGSVILYLGHRVRQPRPLDFQEQLRAIAPSNTNRTHEQPSGIVQLDPGADEER